MKQMVAENTQERLRATRLSSWPEAAGVGSVSGGRAARSLKVPAEPYQSHCSGAGAIPVRVPGWKRALDLALIAAFSPGLVVIGAGVALLVRAGSPGPILFRQRRVGLHGREFVCFKFRTMHENAETKSHQAHTQQLMQSDAPMVKLDAKKDPRLIPLGRALRATGLDELPQILNVLKGEMSLVGPRPCVPYEYALYEPWQRERFKAVPGLTGLWQVSGKNNTTFNQMIQFDIEYARRASLWLDLQIILRTLPALGKQCLETRVRRHAAKAASPTLTEPVKTQNV